MGFVVVALIIGVIYLAQRAPAPDGANSGSPGPDVNVPALGATSTPSPAMTGGTPHFSRQNQLRHRTNQSFVEQKRRPVTITAPQPDTNKDVFGGLTNWYKSDGGYQRETRPPAAVVTTQKSLTTRSVLPFKF
jgi:hypothetical protein